MNPPSFGDRSEFKRATLKRPCELTAEEWGSWLQLQAADPNLSSPFFRPEYVAAVAENRPDVEVAVLWDDRRVVGFFPFQRVQRAGLPVGGRLSDYHGVISENGAVIGAYDLLRACHLNCWKFDHVPISQSVFLPHAFGRDVSPVMDLSHGFEAYRNTLPRTGLEELRQTERKARKLSREVGPLRLEFHSGRGEHFDQLLRWKSDQYQRTGAHDVFSHGWTVAVVRRLWGWQSADFAGSLSVLHAGRSPVAIHLGMRSRQVLHWWFPAYDPQFARYSPGRILLAELARAGRLYGLEQIDLGRGMVGYKHRAMSRAVPLCEGRVDLNPLARWLRKVEWHAEQWAQKPTWKRILRIPGRFARRIKDRQSFR